MNVRNGIINNAKTSSSVNQLDNQDVCISVQQGCKEDIELVMTFDSADIAIIKLSNEQVEHLLKMLQEQLRA